VLPEGRQIIWGSFDVSEMHEKLISEDYFSYVAFTQRQMRYKNRRGLDPQVKMFLDQEKIQLSPAWNLPVPNEAAAYKSLAKYGKVEVRLTEQQIKNMNLAWEWTERHFFPYMGNSRIVSLQEAVDRLDMSSSSGFPFNREYSTKRELFDSDTTIMEWLEEDWEALGSDPLWTTIFSSSLKEELRPQEKILENSLRTFTAGATDATVQGNRLFVDQNEKMYAAHTVTSSSIGMSPLKGNWNKLYLKLNVFKNGYALDESQYDSSLRQFLVWGCAQLRWKMLAVEFKTPENFLRIRTYYRNLIHTLILTPEGLLVMKKLGMPSGCVNTVTDNTLILYTLLAYAWISLCPDEFKSYVAFEDNTAKALVGDDNTWTVSDDCHDFFNAVTVIEVWKTVGITTTTDSLAPRAADELDFLSAHTVFIKGIAVPLYSRDKLMTSLLFAPQSKITPATTLQRCTNLLQIGWTDLVYRNFCRQLIAWLLQEYDDVLKENPQWIVAKSSIMSDEVYFTLFTSRKSYFIPTQNYRETQERLNKLDNEVIIMSAKQTTLQIKQKKPRRQRRGPAKGNKPTKVVTKTVMVQQKRRNRRRRQQPKGGSSGAGGTSFGSNKTRSIVVANEEYIGEITVANAPNFNVTSYALNPGQAGTFPWLSKQAQQWEKYEFEQLEFFFKREVSEYAAAGQAGKVILSVDFDASDAPPNTKQQMEDTQPHRDGMSCENLTLKLPKSQMHPVGTIARFVRPAGLPGLADIKTYDVGNLFIATQGITVNGPVGELRVRYKCRLSVPVLEAGNSAPTNPAVGLFVSTAPEALTSNVSYTMNYATVVTNGLGVNVVNGTFNLPAGNYLVDYDVDVISTTSIQNAICFLRIAGTPQLGGGDNFSTTAVNIAAIGLKGIGYVTSRGGGLDSVTITVTATSGGTITASGALRFLAV